MGLQVLSDLRSDPETKEIPVIVVSTQTDEYIIPPLTQLALRIGLVLPACAPAARAPDEVSPQDLLARAIEEAGGAEALSRAKAFVWDGKATVHFGGRVVRIAGRWSVQPPDTVVVSTYDLEEGPAGTRSLVLAAPRGWLVSGNEVTSMPATMLASERAEFYLYELIRLVPLRSPGVTLSAAPPDSLGQQGIRVEQPGRPSAALYFDESGQLTHVRFRVPSVSTGQLEWQDAWLEGTVEAGGVRWPRQLHLLVDGKPYFELTIESLRVLPRLDSPLLRRPP